MFGFFLALRVHVVMYTEGSMRYVQLGNCPGSSWVFRFFGH